MVFRLFLEKHLVVHSLVLVGVDDLRKQKYQRVITVSRAGGGLTPTSTTSSHIEKTQNLLSAQVLADNQALGYGIREVIWPATRSAHHRR